MGWNSRFGEGFQYRFSPWRIDTIRLPEDNFHHLTRLLDHPGTFETAFDIRGAGHHSSGAQELGGFFITVDTVLQTEDRGILTDHGAHGRDGFLVVIGLDGKQDQVHRSGLPRVVGSLTLDDKLTIVRNYLETVAPNSFQMGSSSDQRDFVPTQG